MGSACDWLMAVTGGGCDWLLVGGGRGCWVLSPLNTYKVQGSCRQSRELTLNCRLEPGTLSLSSAFTLILGRKDVASQQLSPCHGGKSNLPRVLADDGQCFAGFQFNFSVGN